MPWSYSALGLLLSLLAVSAVAETTQFAYGLNAGDWSLTQYRVNPKTGALRQNGHLPAGKFPAALAVHPSKRFLITAVKTNAEVRVYRIDAGNGQLTEIPQSPFKAGAHSPYSISIHPSGRFVYVSARWGGVVAFSMDQKTGILTPVPGSPFAAELRTRSLKVHPSGRFLYAANAHSNSISAYRINQKTGVLTQLAGSPYGTGATMVVDPNAYHIVDAPATAGGSPFRVEIHPSGRFLYVSNWMGLSLSIFKVNTDTGALTPTKESPLPVGGGGRPYAVTVHPSGRFIYITSWDNHLLWGYRIDQRTGKLTALANNPFSVGGFAPIEIEFSKSGTRAYVVDERTNGIVQYSVDTESGRLELESVTRTRYHPFDFTLLDSEPVEVKQPYSLLVDSDEHRLRVMRMDAAENEHRTKRSLGKKDLVGEQLTATAVGPRGHFVYRAINKTDMPQESGIAVYRIDPVSDLLAPSPVQTFTLGFSPTDLVVGKSGRFLYAINPTINSLGVFSIDRDSGAISVPINPENVYGLPPITGKNPVAVALDPAERFSFVANAKDNTVSVFTHRHVLSPAMNPINKTGSSFPAGENPVALEVDPTGNYLVVANKGSNNLSVFSIHFHEGKLTTVTGSPFASGDAPVSVAVHPGGKFVYALNAGSEDISSYRLDSKTGELKELSQRISAGKQPVKIILDSAGRFAYVQNKGVSALRKYTIDSVSGELAFSNEVDLGSSVTIVR